MLGEHLSPGGPISSPGSRARGADMPGRSVRTATLRGPRRVGTSWRRRGRASVRIGRDLGGGFITAGYALRHPATSRAWSSWTPGPVPQPAARSSRRPPGTIRRTLSSGTTCRSRRTRGAGQIGDIPVSVVTVEYSPADMDASPFASEQAMMRDNVEAQQGWLVSAHRPSRSWCRRVGSRRRPALVIE